LGFSICEKLDCRVGGLSRDASRHPFFKVLFGIQSFGNENDSENKKTSSTFMKVNIFILKNLILPFFYR
jgi:hypothetical protein